MDRFIGEMGINDVENMQHFKIQYGQIYRNGKIQQSGSYVYSLKSNMDRFIG